ncbi:unnamed protein product [Zymoseptoria tritici ST99CH_3D1]|nr:unnamed protein product [Zymoseptoria tritici ST99CH_3D1]
MLQQRGFGHQQTFSVAVATPNCTNCESIFDLFFCCWAAGARKGGSCQAIINANCQSWSEKGGRWNFFSLLFPGLLNASVWLVDVPLGKLLFPASM